MINSIFSRMAIGMMVAAQILVNCSKDNNNEPNDPNEPAKVGEHGEVLNNLATQNGYMVLKGKGYTNGNWYLILTVDDEALINTVWVDFNNNGKKDTGEETFDTYERRTIFIKQKVESEVIIIYGAVSYLKCDSQQLTVLDASHNPTLTYLECYENQLTTLEVSQNTKLISLICYKNNLDEASMTKLVGSLPVNKEGKFYGWVKTGETNYRGDNLKDLFKKNMWLPYIDDKQWFDSQLPAPEDIETGAYGQVINKKEAAKFGYMVLKRKNADGDWWFQILCKPKDKANVWADFNNNGRKDEYENVIEAEELNIRRRYDAKGPVQSEVITVYGIITEFKCVNQDLTVLDTNQNKHLVSLEYDRNQITTLNIDQNKNLKKLSCSENNFTQSFLMNLVLPPGEGIASFCGWLISERETNKYNPEIMNEIRNQGWIPKRWDGKKWL